MRVFILSIYRTKWYIPFVEEVFFTNDFIFIQDSALSIVEGKFQTFWKNTDFTLDWPRNCPDFHPLDYFFWAKVQQNVHECRHCKCFPSIKELTNLSKPGMTALRTYIPSEKPWNNSCHLYVLSLKEKVETV